VESLLKSPPPPASLKEYRIPIHPQVQGILTNQLVSFNSSDEAAAAQHLNRILEALKIPPSTSICRVNLLENTREQAIKNTCQHFENSWDLKDSVNVHVRPNVDWPDVIEIKVTSKGKVEPINLFDHSLPLLKGNEKNIFHDWPRRDGWPMTHRVIVCDRFCAEAVLRGSHVFVRGILCADAKIQADEIVAVYGHLYEKTKPTRGTMMCDYLEQVTSPCLFLGMGRTHCARANFFSDSSGIGVSMTSERAAPLLTPLHGLTGVYVQNFPSILVGHALNPQPGDVVLDMCCAPGGKTTHLANLMQNKGLVVACEKSRKKVAAMHELVTSMKGVTCIIPLALDSTKCVDEMCPFESIHELLDGISLTSSDNLSDVKGFPPASFDRILLDPPCSALGLRPKLSISIKAKELGKHAEYQRLFIAQAVKLLKPGGVMTYSTCTINALENEANVAFILQQFEHCMELIPLNIPGQEGLPGHGLTDRQRSCVRRFDPSDQGLDCMGFFIAKLQKRNT